MVALFVVAAACARGEATVAEPPALDVRCVTVSPQSFDETLTLPGRLEPPPGADLPVASQVPGRIVELLAREGQRVAVGATVAIVDGASSRDALHQAEATLAQTRASEANARATLERVTALVARGIAARQELDDARTRAESEHQGVRSAAAAADVARRTVSRVTVRSPISGMVTRVWRGPGSLVDGTSATAVIQVADVASADFVVAGTAGELVGVGAGQPATVHFDGDPAGYQGEVRLRSLAIDPATGLGLARIAVGDLDGGVTMGAYGSARILTKHRDGVVTLPPDAVRGALADGAEVVVCDAGRAEVRAVRLGYRDARIIEVVSGLRAGERVAVDHVMGLATGTPIQVTD